MSLINREALYEKACDLEAQALAYVGKIANDETKIEEWKIWSAILVERTAFKHDIFDAPSVQPVDKDINVSCKDAIDGEPQDFERILDEPGHKTCKGCVHLPQRYKFPCTSCARNTLLLDRWEEGEQE